MAWDSSRPVPWRRLVREWLVYAGIMVVIFVLFFRDDGAIGAIAGVLISGPLYLFLGYVLAKLGYQRKTLRDARAARDQPVATAAASTDTSSRARPAPTRRTAGSGPNRPAPRKRKR